MDISCLGISHHSAPIEIREKLWFSADETRGVVDLLRAKGGFPELTLISTCNRTELYFVAGAEIRTNGSPLWKVMADFKGAGDAANDSHFYQSRSFDAVRHLFRVVSGIDSMVLGDVQILNQAKEGFALAQEMGLTGPMLNRVFHSAFHAGKRARTETEISEGAVSVSYAAAELASKIFEDLSKRTVLLIGAGETGALTARHLVSRNVGTLLICNRTQARAEELAGQLGGATVVPFGDLIPEIVRADIVVSSVEAPSVILSVQDLRKVMRERANRPLCLIDIGVPRNIDPGANTIGNIFLHDLDSLNHLVDDTLARRKAEVPKIERIIDEEIESLRHWYESLEAVPTIQQLREQFELIRQAELGKHIHHFPPDNREEIDLLTRRIINKILHTPTSNLRNGEEAGSDTRGKISMLRHVFGLDKHKDTPDE